MRETRAGGWQVVQVCHYLPGEDPDWWLSELTAVTGSPVLIASVADSGAGLVRGLAPSGAAWAAFLGPRVAVSLGLAEYGAGPDGDEDELEDEDEDRAVRRLLEEVPAVAVQIAGWAAEAGFRADEDAVRAILVREADPFAEDSFFELIDACGLPEADADQD